MCHEFYYPIYIYIKKRRTPRIGRCACVSKKIGKIVWGEKVGFIRFFGFEEASGYRATVSVQKGKCQLSMFGNVWISFFLYFFLYIHLRIYICMKVRDHMYNVSVTEIFENVSTMSFLFFLEGGGRKSFKQRFSTFCYVGDSWNSLTFLLRKYVQHD